MHQVGTLTGEISIFFAYLMNKQKIFKSLNYLFLSTLNNVDQLNGMKLQFESPNIEFECE